MEEEQIELRDERKSMLRDRSGRYAYVLGMLLACAALVAFSILGKLGVVPEAAAELLVYFLAVHFTGRTVHGWTSTIVSIWAIGGLQLLAIGIVGEYIGKIYMETKERPKFIIEKTLDTREETAGDSL